jgi:hypothetical protein
VKKAGASGARAAVVRKRCGVEMKALAMVSSGGFLGRSEAVILRKRKKALLFVNKKKQKNFDLLGALAS